MMPLSIISLIFSLLLQGLASNFLGYTLNEISIFSAIFLLITLIVLQPYFESDKKFLKLLIVFGLLYDITYSNTLILCTSIFIVIFYINKILNFFFPNNVFTINIFSIISMIIYHSLTFAFLKILQYDSFNFIYLLKTILCNIIMTITYTTIVYYIIDYLYKRMNLKIIRD